MISAVVIWVTVHDGRGSADSHVGRGSAVEAHVRVLVKEALTASQMDTF